jgi:hypothetical protein
MKRIFISIDGVLRNLIQKFNYHYKDNFFDSETENEENFKYEITDEIFNDDLTKYFKFQSEEEYKNFIDAISLLNEIEYEEGEEDKELKLCLYELKDIGVREKRRQITQEIKKAEQAGDNQKVSDLIGEFNLIN